MKNIRICFFDVDHTITRKSTGLRFALRAVKAGYVKPGVLLSLPWFYIRYRLGGIKADDLEGEFSSLSGIPQWELEELGEDTFKKTIVKDIFPDALELIRTFRAEGIEVVIATSSIDLVILPLARYLGVDTVLAGALEFSQGKSTGRFEGKLHFGENKKREALSFLQQRGISPEECAFYSDSIHDLPLLEAVGTPVAVNPDIRLTRWAQRQGWKIIYFR